MEKNTNILVVDDDSGIGEMLKTLLEINGFKVTLTEKPQETEELIQKYNIDLIILDMLISGINGTDVCRRLRQNENTSNIPILMMSALHEAGVKCKNAGANDFIAKPFEMKDLLLKIDLIMKKNRNPISKN